MKGSNYMIDKILKEINIVYEGIKISSTYANPINKQILEGRLVGLLEAKEIILAAQKESQKPRLCGDCKEPITHGNIYLGFCNKCHDANIF